MFNRINKKQVELFNNSVLKIKRRIIVRYGC
jgi:hypothetical protein